MFWRVIQRGTVFVLLAALLTLGVRTKGAEEEPFYRQLAELIDQKGTQGFFEEMTLTLGTNRLVVDGTEYQMDVSPEVKNERTMLPFRAVAEAMGATVEYDPQARQARVVSAGGDVVLCPMEGDMITVNGQQRELDVPGYAKDGRIYLPVRAVAEALGLEVEWRQEDASVILTAPYQTARIIVLSDRLNADELGAETVLTDGDGLWVLQFSTPLKAKAANDQLTARGIPSAPDNRITITAAS